METVDERSAGGILIRPGEPDNDACLIKVKTRGGNPTWRLPKGAIEEGESAKEAGIRETREETGCVGEVLSEVSDIEYWYTRRPDDDKQQGGDSSNQKVRVRKHVRFYVMKYLEGDVDDHDDEVETARWFSLPEAVREISYDAERQVLQEAIYAWEAYLYRQGFDDDDNDTEATPTKA
jgi:8-oxo-dGTP pyrophosphatase MutT (NUDIX family)